MTAIITAQNVRKSFGSFEALKGIDLSIHKGQIVGLIGANGAGKTTLLNSILGLSNYEGDLDVLGYSPFEQRDDLMQNICFISDVATLPKWIKVHQVVDFVEGVHPKFDREKALQLLKGTTIPMDKKVRALSKGMIVQLHLALILSIDANILVLDEPTLGLDILYRKKFYNQLLEDYFDEERTILVTTHQVDEIENILTDALFIREGRIVLDQSMEEIGQSWSVLHPASGKEEAARALSPVSEQKMLGKSTFVYKDAVRKELEALGSVERLSLSDLFVTLMDGGPL